jgi:hypothetical protein
MNISIPSFHGAGTPETSTIILRDRHACLPEYGATPCYLYNPIIPSALFFASRDLEGTSPSLNLPRPSYRRPFDSLAPEWQDLGFSGGAPLEGQIQGGDSQYHAPFAMDPDDYAVLLDLMFPTADFSHPQRLSTPHRQPIPNQLPSACVNPQRPPPPGYNISQVPAPARQSGVSCEVPVVGQPPGVLIWKYIETRDDGSCGCLWVLTSGDPCPFRSSLEQVKKHLKRTHYKLRWVLSGHITQFLTYVAQGHINALIVGWRFSTSQRGTHMPMYSELH